MTTQWRSLTSVSGGAQLPLLFNFSSFLPSNPFSLLFVPAHYQSPTQVLAAKSEGNVSL